MSNQNDNKMDPWIKIIVLGVGVAGAIFGAAKYILGQRESAQRSGQYSGTNSSRSYPVEEELKECILCSNRVDEMISFLPCTHRVAACASCCARVKKCLSCHRPIAVRLTDEGKEIPFNKHEEDICFICCENKKTIVLNCFHTVCKTCSNKISSCPICRVTITSRNHFY